MSANCLTETFIFFTALLELFWKDHILMEMELSIYLKYTEIKFRKFKYSFKLI